MGASDAAELRVAIVTGQLAYGGAEHQLTQLALHAADFSVSPEVFCLGGTDLPYGPVLAANGIPVRTIHRHGRFDVRRVFDLARALRHRRFDVVHSFLISDNPYGFLAAKLVGIPVFIASNRNVDFPRGVLYAALDGLVFRHASAIVVNAEAVRDFTARRFRVAPDRFTVVYNGVDLDRFRPRERPSGPPVVGTIGRLHPKKNPDLFAEVCRAVRTRFPDVECRHFGDGVLRDALHARHGDVVRYLGNTASPEDFLAAVDVFVLTSDQEGCPNVVLEAMACARPVVATDAGGVREIVRDGETGFVVGRQDIAALTDRVSLLLRDSQLRSRLAAAARADVEHRFGLRRMVDEMTRLYRTAAAVTVH